MALNDAQWNDLLAYMNDVAERSEPYGIGKSIETPEEFIKILRAEWDDCIQPAKILDKAKTREYVQMVKARINMDDKIVRTQLDNAIAGCEPSLLDLLFSTDGEIIVNCHEESVLRGV